MKKILPLIFSLLLSLSMFSGCGTTGTKNGPKDIHIATLSGATSMGLVSFMDHVDQGIITDQNYDFSILTAPDEISTGLVKGTYDFATVPANLASVLFANTDGAIQVLGINTLGVLYIVESGNEINSVSDLSGKTIYASGKGSTPEFALHYILTENDLVVGEDVTIEWKSEQAECLAAIAGNENAIAMLPQPFVTSAQMQNDSIRIALDLTAEWNAVQSDNNGTSKLITGVVIGRKEFIQNNPDAVAHFLENYEESVTFVNANTSDAAALIGKYGIVKEEIALKALPACNIVFIKGEEMKTALNGYLDVLFAANAKSVGGSTPTDDFYYISE